MLKRLVPVDLLFTSDEVLDGNALSNLISVVCHRPMMTLLRNLIYGTGSLDAYWKWLVENHSETELDKEAHLVQWRKKIWQMRWIPMASRPLVSKLTRDRLVLSSGLERACLAKVLDKRWIQVDMPDEIGKLWDKRSVSKLQVVVQKTGRKEFYNPILHESYRRAWVTRPDSIRLDRIRRLLGNCGEGLRGLDIGCNMGYTSHMLQRQGFQMTGVDFDEQHLDVARALNDTYQLDTNLFNLRFEELDVESNFDIVVMLTVLYHTLNRDESEAVDILSKIDQLGTKILLWESGAQPQREIDFIREHSGLTDYLALGSTEATGKCRELGDFLRPSLPLSDRLSKRHHIEFANEILAT